jgi:Tol biopolymer transport system component
VDVDGDTTRQVTASTGNESGPAVAPNGRSIAFTQEDTDFDVFLIPLDGSAPHPLLVTSRNELDPAWSPRDRQYAYVSDRTGNEQIWLRSRDGQWERPLVTDADFGETSLTFGALAFSPDGQRLAYQRQGADGYYHLYISPLGGGRPARAAAGVQFQNAAAWSPDGNWIAFSSSGGLAKVRVGSTADPVLLNAEVVSFSRPAWSPDGKWIACDDRDGLVLVSPDNGQAHHPETSNWLAYGWGADATTLFGLKGSEADPNHYVFASLDINSGRAREIGQPIGTIPLANDPIRGFTFIPGEGFLTSIARVHSDLWMLEGFEPPGRPWASWRLWRRP